MIRICIYILILALILYLILYLICIRYNIIIDIQEPGKLTMQFDTTNMDAYGNGGVARFFFAAEEAVPAGE